MKTFVSMIVLSVSFVAFALRPQEGEIHTDCANRITPEAMSKIIEKKVDLIPHSPKKGAGGHCNYGENGSPATVTITFFKGDNVLLKKLIANGGYSKFEGPWDEAYSTTGIIYVKKGPKIIEVAGSVSNEHLIEVSKVAIEIGF